MRRASVECQDEGVCVLPRTESTADFAQDPRYIGALDPCALPSLYSHAGIARGVRQPFRVGGGNGVRIDDEELGQCALYISIVCEESKQ